MKSPSDRRVEFLDAAVELLGEGEAVAIAVRDGDVSMKPTLHSGQLLWVDLTATGLDAGDVLLFRQQDYLVVHRLLGHTRFPDGRPSLRTRGDGLNGLDPHLDPELVVGRVVAARDARGWWDIRRPGARLYGRAVGWHNLFWAAAGSVAGVVDRALLRQGDRGPLRAAVGAVDRALLALAHALFFNLMHSRREAPGAAAPAAIIENR